MQRFDLWLEQYGYLGEVTTDIAVPRWRDKPSIPRQMFTRFFFDAHSANKARVFSNKSHQSISAKIVQKRLNLKNSIAELYNKLLANLRWSFLAIEQQWLNDGKIDSAGEIFLLKLEEVVAVVENQEEATAKLTSLIAKRKQQWSKERALTTVPKLVYGQPVMSAWTSPTVLDSASQFKGIGTSAGQIEGKIAVISSLDNAVAIDARTIIVVPYTDAGWSPLLARAGGLISEVGGRLSHGAIVAREYNIPAVMDVANATQMFQDGQTVRINGSTGIIELL